MAALMPAKPMSSSARRAVSPTSTSPPWPRRAASSSRATRPATGWPKASSSAGDVNGDGLDDIIVGASTNDDGGSSCRQAYVVFGKADGFPTSTSSALLPGEGFIIQGDVAYDFAGQRLRCRRHQWRRFRRHSSSAHSRPTEAAPMPARPISSTARPGGFTNIDLTTLAPSDGFIIQGDDADDQAGRASPRRATSTATASTTSSSARPAATMAASMPARPMYLRTRQRRGRIPERVRAATDLNPASGASSSATPPATRRA